LPKNYWKGRILSLTPEFLTLSTKSEKGCKVLLLQIQELGERMLNNFNELFGNGEAGTVTTEHLVEGPARRHPKGLLLMT